MAWRYLNVARKKNVPGEHTHWDAVRQNRVRAFLATNGTRVFLDGALSDQFHSADYSFAFAPNYRKGAGNQSRRGWIFFLFDLGRVRDRLVRLRLPSVPFESQNHHCGFQCGRWFGPPGNITDEKFMAAMRMGLFGLGFAAGLYIPSAIATITALIVRP